MKTKDEIKQRITELKAQAKVLMDKEGATPEELKQIRREIEAENEKLEVLSAMDKVQAGQAGKRIDLPQDEDAEKAYKKAFSIW